MKLRRRRRVQDARLSARARVPRASVVTRGTTELVLRLCATLSVLRPLPAPVVLPGFALTALLRAQPSILAIGILIAGHDSD